MNLYERKRKGHGCIVKVFWIKAQKEKMGFIKNAHFYFKLPFWAFIFH